jgi:hypothetical protein
MSDHTVSTPELIPDDEQAYMASKCHGIPVLDYVKSVKREDYRGTECGQDEGLNHQPVYSLLETFFTDK